MRFVEEHAGEWSPAVQGHIDGSGSPMKYMNRWQSLHSQYLAIMEVGIKCVHRPNCFILFFVSLQSWLTHIVESNGGTLDLFMDDARKALAGGSGFLFDDDNYSDFVESINAMGDYEVFHAFMMKRASRMASQSHK